MGPIHRVFSVTSVTEVNGQPVSGECWVKEQGLLPVVGTEVVAGTTSVALEVIVSCLLC